MHSAQSKRVAREIAIRIFAGLWLVGALMLAVFAGLLLFPDPSPRPALIWKLAYGANVLPSLVAIWFSARFLVSRGTWQPKQRGGYQCWPYLAVSVLIYVFVAAILDRDGISLYLPLVGTSLAGFAYLVESRGWVSVRWSLFLFATVLYTVLVRFAFGTGFVLLKLGGPTSDQSLGLAGLFAINVFANVYWYALFSKYEIASR